MDCQSILQAITLCVKAHSQQEIVTGQAVLEKSAVEPGYPQKLMMIADQSDITIDIRQFAVANLKTNIKKYWSPKEDKPFRFSQEDKAVVRNSLMDALIRSADNRKLSKLYCKIIYDVCAYDYPTQWPNLITDATDRMMASENPSEIFGCCLTIQQVFDILQFDMSDKRKNIEDIIPIVLPAFQTLISKLMAIYNADNAYILKPMLKVFHMCICLDLPVSLQNYDVLSQWINFLKLLVDSEMPQNLTIPTQDEDTIQSRDKHPLWKNKKWAGKIFFKFITRYANQQICTEEKLKALAQWLIDSHMGNILDSFVKQLILSQTTFVGNACVHFGIRFLTKVFKYKSLYERFQPHIETILYDTLFPLLWIKPKDNELWESDPAEFIRQEDDFINSGMGNNKNLAMDLIKCICQNTFSGSTYLHQFVQFCAQYIDSNASPRNNQPLNLAIKDGIFFAVGQLKELILKDELLKNQLEPLLEKYVIPEFQNPNGFIKSRTCWVIGKYGYQTFLNNQNVIASVQGISSCMKDENLPVRFKAALALNSILSQKQAQEMIKGYLSDILRIYLKLMEEIDSEELVAALEGIVEQFSNDIGPFAYDLCVHLSSAFYKYKSKDNEPENDDDGECQLAAGGCLDAIGKILNSPISPDVLKKLEDIVLPILNTCLIDDQCDYMDESLYLLQQLTFRSTAIEPSSQLWFYYPVLIYIVIGKEDADLSLANHLNQEQKLLLESAINGWGPEHTNEIVIILKNFIQKGGDFFFTANDLFGKRFIDLVFLFISGIYQKCIEGGFDDDEETGMKNCLTVLYCLIENNLQTQKLSNGILPQIIQLTIQNLNTNKIKNDVIVANLETLCLCFYYNSTETFSILVNAYGIPIVQTLFQKWFNLLKHFKSDFSKQRLLLAFTSILACPTIPEEIRAITPQILKQCVSITSEIVKLREEEDFEDCDDDDEDGKEDGKEFQVSLNEHIQNVQNYTKNQVVGATDELDDDDFDDSFDPLDRYNYNYNYSCPLENVDEILVLEQQLLNIAQTNSQYYAAITSILTEEDKHALQNNIVESKRQYEEYLKSKQEKAQGHN
ncbi:hypothetical protein ABPG72_004032 [Tetrahymena utriculariae]